MTKPRDFIDLTYLSDLELDAVVSAGGEEAANATYILAIRMKSMKAEVDANPGVAMVQQGNISLKLDHDGRYWFRVDEFRGATHSLEASCTDAERLFNHWSGFVHGVKRARETSAKMATA